MTYIDFLIFCFNGDLSNFYTGLRWANWKEEVPILDRDKVFNFYPPLWTKQGKDINHNSRSAVPIEEQYSFSMSAGKQLSLD